MPSDPSGVQPKGTLVRQAPDWFDDEVGVAGFHFVELTPPPGNHYFRISLYNNTTTGRLFKVYAITVENQGGGGLLFWFNKGALGTFKQNAAALRPDVGAPDGQVYFDNQDTAAGTLNPYLPATIVGQLGAAGFDSTTVISPFPLAIVPAGYALVLANPSSSLSDGATFWYHIANE